MATRSSGVFIIVGGVELIEDLELAGLVVDYTMLGSGQDLLQLLDLLGFELTFLGHLDFELDEEVTS